MRDSSAKRARSIVRYVLETPLPERGHAMTRVVHELASRRQKYLKDNTWLPGIDMIASEFTRQSLEERDCTFLNDIFSVSAKERPSQIEHTRTELMMSYFEYVGENIERTRTFCRVMYGDLAEQLAQALVGGHAGLKSFLSPPGAPLMVAVIWESVYCSATSDAPLKKWFSNLVDAYSSTGDEEIFRWLEAIWWIITTKNTKVQIFDQTALQSFLASKGIALVQYLTTEFDPDYPMIVLETRDQTKRFGKFLQDMSKNNLRDTDVAGEWCRWFLHYSLELNRELASMRNSIIDNPSRLVRRNGLDRIDVRKLTILKDLGIEYIAFHPSGKVFPDMDIVFGIRWFGCLTTEIRCSMTDFSLSAPDELLEGCARTEHANRLRVLEYLVVDGLYRIVVNCERHSCSSDHNGSQTGMHTRVMTGACPHFPRLRDGAKASTAAIDLCAAETGFKPPNGRTYNKGWVPDGDEVTADVRPRVVFTDDLLSNGS